MAAKMIYLDQSVYGHMLDYDSGGWRQSPMGRELVEAQTAGTGEVWFSPVNVMETAQASEPRRSQLAKCMLDLAGARRVLPGHDFILVEKFGHFLNSFAPGSFNLRGAFPKLRDDASRLWLGYLALMAAAPGVTLGPGIEDLRRAKPETRLLAARFAANPDETLDRMITSAEKMQVTHDSDPLGLCALSRQQIDQETEQLLAQSVPSLTGSTRRKLAQHRRVIAERYGGVEVGAMLDSVFPCICTMITTIISPALIEHWCEAERRYGPERAPPRCPGGYLSVRETRGVREPKHVDVRHRSPRTRAARQRGDDPDRRFDV
ncbi:MAG: hypothetical protein V3V08_04715 [Nannocystaceae bacterium]